jgi:hypothetical protein
LLKQPVHDLADTHKINLVWLVQKYEQIHGFSYRRCSHRYIAFTLKCIARDRVFLVIHSPLGYHQTDKKLWYFTFDGNAPQLGRRDLQLFLLGVLVTLTPSLLALAWLLWREDHSLDLTPRSES